MNSPTSTMRFEKPHSLSYQEKTFTNLPSSATVESINKAFQEAANGRLKGVLQYNTELTVSVDYNGNPASAIYDSTQTAVAEGGKLAKVFAWYDNEWGFSNRMVDVALLMGGKL